MLISLIKLNLNALISQWVGGGHLFKFEFEWRGGGVGVGAYSKWVLIRGWALIRIKLIWYLDLFNLLPFNFSRSRIRKKGHKMSEEKEIQLKKHEAERFENVSAICTIVLCPVLTLK